MIRALSLAALLVALGGPASAQFTSDSGGGSGGGGFSGSFGSSGGGSDALSSGGSSSYGGGTFTTPSVAEPVRPAPYRQAIPNAPAGQPFTDPSPARSPRF